MARVCWIGLSLVVIKNTDLFQSREASVIDSVEHILTHKALNLGTVRQNHAKL